MARDQKAAGGAVEARMAERGLTVRALASEAGVDVATVRTLINGERWPQAPTRGRIEQALGWLPGHIAAIAEGRAPSVREPSPLQAASDAELIAEVARRLASRSVDRPTEAGSGQEVPHLAPVSDDEQGPPARPLLAADRQAEPYGRPDPEGP